MNFAEADNGMLIMCDGYGPALRWDGLTNAADTAGVLAPTAAPVLSSGTTPGQIVGDYDAYLRFVDPYGNLSNLSPISNTITPTTSSGVITGASNTTPIVITSAGHGLYTGVWVKIGGVGGNVGANGTWQITVIDANNFSLDDSAGTGSGVTAPVGSEGVGGEGTLGIQQVPEGQTSTATGAYNGGGTWTAGANSIIYTGVQIPTEPKVVRRQLLRNTDGQAGTYYVDIDTTDLTSTTFTSTRIDTDLDTSEAVPLFDTNGRPLANRYDPPPAHKGVPVEHLGRMFYLVEYEYTQGNAQVVFGSNTVQGIGTEWMSAMVGRFFYVDGEQQGYQITAVDPTNQVLTLQGPIVNYVDNVPVYSGGYQGATDKFAAYTIRPAPAERRLVYYSEAGLPEAVPPTNAIAVQEDGDELSGGMVRGSFLYILERKHIYRFTFQGDPANDGFIFRAATRGCINQRCWVNTDDATFMLDEAGIHAFAGGEQGQPVSTPVQDLFRPGNFPYRINWKAYKLFHANYFPMQETIRWYVCLDGYYLPHHCIAYEYRKQRWWIEQHDRPIGASLDGRQKTVYPMLGTDAKKVFSYWAGTLDGPQLGTGTLRGYVTSAGVCSLTDNLAAFPGSGVVGNAVCIVNGTGRGQRRIVDAVSGQTLQITEPWSVQPDASSIYQLGGIAWDYKSGAFRFLDGEDTEERRIEVVGQPTTQPCLARMNIFYNRLPKPETQKVLYNTVSGEGVSSQVGDPDFVLDLTKSIGFWQKRISNHKELYADGVRFLELEMFGFTNADVITFNFVNIDGVHQ
jgi:hypothetical protein